MTDHGAFHWNELMTNDVEGAKAFYASTLGWTYDEFPAMNFTYWVCMSNGKPVGGIMPLQDVAPDGAGPHWFAHIAVDDVDARAKAVEQAGGSIVREPFDIPGVGRVAILFDATGAGIGLVTPAET